MNKTVSFYVSMLVALFVGFVAVGFTIPQKWSQVDITPLVIYWYMLWKLFHDKKKDE